MKQIRPTKAKVHKVEPLLNSCCSNQPCFRGDCDSKLAITLKIIERSSLSGSEDFGYQRIRTLKVLSNFGWIDGVGLHHEGKEAYVIYHETPKGRLVLDHVMESDDLENINFYNKQACLDIFSYDDLDY
ncbi:hypothetical protein [uncultured Mediterranean phage uvMED]|nr:hypothetical protein [uncultured Mediterranean phage uvMED]